MLLLQVPALTQGKLLNQSLQNGCTQFKEQKNPWGFRIFKALVKKSD